MEVLLTAMIHQVRPTSAATALTDTGNIHAGAALSIREPSPMTLRSASNLPPASPGPIPFMAPAFASTPLTRPLSGGRNGLRSFSMQSLADADGGSSPLLQQQQQPLTVNTGRNLNMLNLPQQPAQQSIQQHPHAGGTWIVPRMDFMVDAYAALAAASGLTNRHSPTTGGLLSALQNSTRGYLASSRSQSFDLTQLTASAMQLGTNLLSAGTNTAARLRTRSTSSGDQYPYNQLTSSSNVGVSITAVELSIPPDMQTGLQDGYLEGDTTSSDFHCISRATAEEGVSTHSIVAGSGRSGHSHSISSSNVDANNFNTAVHPTVMTSPPAALTFMSRGSTGTVFASSGVPSPLPPSMRQESSQFLQRESSNSNAKISYQQYLQQIQQQQPSILPQTQSNAPNIFSSLSSPSQPIPILNQPTTITPTMQMMAGSNPESNLVACKYSSCFIYIRMYSMQFGGFGSHSFCSRYGISLITHLPRWYSLSLNDSFDMRRFASYAQWWTSCRWTTQPGSFDPAL